MNKDNLLRILVGVVFVLAVYQAYQLAAQRKAAEIARITSQADSLRVENQMIRQMVAFRDSIRYDLEEEVDSLRGEAVVLRSRSDSVELDRRESRVELLSLRDAQDVAQEFRDAFPLLEPEMKVLNAPRPGSTFAIDWLVVPLGDAQAFISYKNDAEAYKEEVGLLARVDTLQQEAAVLGDSITALVAANADAYQEGYDRALNSYLDLVPRYVNELRRPSLELPNRWGVIAGAVIGAGVCLVR